MPAARANRRIQGAPKEQVVMVYITLYAKVIIIACIFIYIKHTFVIFLSAEVKMNEVFNIFTSDLTRWQIHHSI